MGLSDSLSEGIDIIMAGLFDAMGQPWHAPEELAAIQAELVPPLTTLMLGSL